ncbi:uncharacterized protein LOC108744543 isoform X2 [Agrilus planipennis]|nr:uncharacterized protein LOC108744543 isoform X2 [Agrilus planipennis]XP_018335865.1 uncharacterized protein LOC108744543 isoform X2 [Agrilus planipennis]
MNTSCCQDFVTIEIANATKLLFCNKTSIPPFRPRGKDITIRLVSGKDAKASSRIRFTLFYSVRDDVKTTCAETELECLDGMGCYNVQDACNSKFECNDHSDEINCGHCPENMAMCNINFKRRCFNPSKQRCDGELSCPFGEDEIGCSPKCSDGLSCTNGFQCIKKDKICNDIVDCSDKKDEENCTQRFCGDSYYHFLCTNKRCIRKSVVNNGFDDCGDGSDETDIYNQQNNHIIVLSIIFTCCILLVVCCGLVMKWRKTRINVNDVLADLPQFPLSPFRGPRENEQTETEVQYSESDFLFGGPIYEEFADVRRRSERRRKKRNQKRTEQQEANRRKNFMSDGITIAKPHESGEEHTNDNFSISMTISNNSISSTHINDSFLFKYYFDSFVDSNQSLC